MSKKNIADYHYVLGYSDGLNALLQELQQQSSYITEEEHEATKGIMAVVRSFAMASNCQVGALRRTMSAEDKRR